MMYRGSIIILFVLLSFVPCFGQSSFQGLTPGSSTRNDVARALGQPARTITSTLFEHAPPAGIAKVDVEYGEWSAFAERMEVTLNKPVSRQALAAKFNLPQRADEMRISEEGRLVEYFGGSALLSFTYAAKDTTSGVTSIAYYSRALFEGTVRRLRREVDVPLLKANVLSLRFYNSEIVNLPRERRVYQTRFMKSQATAIFYELRLGYPPPGQITSFETEAIYYEIDGNVLTKLIAPRTIEGHSTGSYISSGFRRESWHVGICRVEVFIGGRKIATGSFEVY